MRRSPFRFISISFIALLLLALRASAGIVTFTANPTVFLPGQEVTLSWSVSVGDVISINQGVGAVSGTTGSVKVIPTVETTYILKDATSGTSAQVTARPPTVAVPKNRWSFNEASGTTVDDSIGGAAGTIRGAPFTRPAGQVSLAGGSAASAAYIDLPNGLISTLTDATFEGWVTINGSQSWSRLFEFGKTNQTSPDGVTGELTGPGSPSGNTTGTDYLLLTAQVGADQTLKRVVLRDNSATEQGVSFSDPAVTGQQFHFALVYDSRGNNGAPQVRYYKNGALIGSLNTTVTLASVDDVNNWLGRSNFTTDSNLNGSYNEFRIWNGAMNVNGIANSIAAGPDALSQAVNVDSFTVFPTSTITAGQSVRLSYVLANPSGSAFTASIDQGVGALTGTSGYITVTPAGSTTYTLTTIAGATTRTAKVTVAVIPTAPTAENLSVIVKYQTATPVTLVGYDYTAPSLTYAVVTPPAHGTLSGTAPNLTYTPAASYSGADSFTYKANDGSDSNIATVSITVNPAPLPPASMSLSEDSLYTDLLTGSFAGLLKTLDGNPDDTFTYALVAGTGSTNNGFFTVSGNQLIAAHDFAGDLNQTISIRVSVTDSAGNSIEQVLTHPVTARPPHVKFNELNYDPARNAQLSEFIELYNPTGAAVDLSNWRLAKGVDFVFPTGTTIAAGGYVVIAENPSTIGALYGVTALGPWTGGLSSDGDTIELRNTAGVAVDKLTYGNTAPWPAPPNGDGPTLELLHPALDNDLGGSWRASTVTQPAITYVAKGSTGWRYRKGTSEASVPINAWRAAAFTENATWLNATLPAGLFNRNGSVLATLPETGVTLGTQLTDMATFVSSNANSGTNYTVNYRSVFLRKTFTVSSPIPRSVLLRVMHNDAAIVWINGVEVGRFGFYPGAPTDPPFNTNAYYELGNDPWSETVLLNAGGLLQDGTNIICIEGFAKPPQTRAAQDNLSIYNLFDFCVDAELKSSPDILGTPGAQNSVFTNTPPPAVRDLDHSPRAPKPWEAVTVTARISDPQGVGSVQLKYQSNAPGAYIPSTLPLTNAQLLANPLQNLPANPAFENVANWTTMTMVDDGSVAGDTAGDGVFTGRIPARPHRTLVRYRIVATDLGGASVTVPSADDPRKNFAYFVYNRAALYTSGGQTFAPSTLETLPIYQWIMRSADVTRWMAYSGADQFVNTSDLNVLLARRYENFEGTLVVGDQVLDHVVTRLRGGNSRYNGSGKRHFRFNFAKGTSLDAADEAGRKYGRPWEAMLFNKMFGNKGYYDYGIPYEVGGKLWTQQGTPMPNSHWVHFRVVQNANETDATLGDFWGMYQALELPEGKNFLRNRELPLGNFYKMSDWTQNGELDQRYQAPGAVDFAEDFDNIRYNMHQCASQSDLERYMNMPKWYRYDAVKEAIRHYDIFTEPTGRHRVKNLIWWFAPMANTNGLGQLVQMPYDWDASFGPNWNSGWDFIHNALYDHDQVTDSPTWTGVKPDRTPMRIEHRNVIRELRDLVWYRDGARGPVDDMIDDAAATIAAFAPADTLRWPSPGAQVVYTGGVAAKVADMKAFCFTGWTDAAGNGDPAVGAGGRAAYLDSISDALDVNVLPTKPTISYTGTASFPVDSLAFTSSAFSDPQGAGTFGAIQWRVGEVTDPAAPGYDPTAERIYEAVAVYDSGALNTFNASHAIPATALRIGHTYRARVRHRDITGRFGHWSAPVQFTVGNSNYIQTLKDNLVVNELMYHPATPIPPYAESDYEYIELLNISPSLTLNLANVRLTKGVNFDFAGSAITSLAPGARVLVVKNSAAFISRYGGGKPIAGSWSASDSLSNSGEEVKLSYGAGAAIQDFTYSDSSPWPSQADAGGYSLVLRAPETRPDHAVATNWRACYIAGGSPGGADRQTYAEWAAANQATDSLTDDDFDGLNNATEYALGGTNTTNDMSRLPVATLATYMIGVSTEKFLTLTIRRPLGADDATMTVEWSAEINPASWAIGGAIMSRVDNGDGTQTEVWRCSSPISAGHFFGRVKFTIP